MIEVIPTGVQSTAQGLMPDTSTPCPGDPEQVVGVMVYGCNGLNPRSGQLLLEDGSAMRRFLLLGVPEKSAERRHEKLHHLVRSVAQSFGR